jgi:hypothetical protein
MNNKTDHPSFPTPSREAAANQPNTPQELLRDMAALTQAAQEAVNGSVTDVVGGWVAAQYAGTIRTELAGAEGARRWELMRACVQDWTKLRHGDQVSARLQLAREQLDWSRAKNQFRKEAEFREWLKRPEIRQELFPEPKAASPVVPDRQS